jgi:hypothetical protein
MAANGDTALAGMGYTYISVLVLCSPLVFVLSINIAAMRSEGLLTAMTAIMLMSALLEHHCSTTSSSSNSAPASPVRPMARSWRSSAR